ncbi:uncharacterized protein LOC119680524 [Teleopsis dalmanni]|uniref:uncharacterized protein LOC119680524 n=1 Tax=Teleopsis dalmanni TaxID=139649 RepID=UPI0018CFB15D|nr:uncharacterized protein LOC119680524 [Teleopsis dalmanni]
MPNITFKNFGAVAHQFIALLTTVCNRVTMLICRNKSFQWIERNIPKEGSIPNNVNSNLNQLNSLDSPPAVEEHETAQLAHNNASNNSTNEQYLTQVLVVNDTKIDAPTLPANVEPIARIVSNGNEIRSVIMAHCNVTAPIAREEEANCVCATENIENGNVDNAVKRSKSRVRNYLKKCKDRLTGHCNQSTNLESITESIPTTVTTTTAAITTTATTTTNATVNTITDTITAYSPPVVQALGTICERSVECLAEMNLTSLDAADEDECSYDDINFSLTSSITMTGNEINPDNCDNVTLSELNCDTSIRDERLARMLQLKPNVSDLIDKHLSHIYPVYFEYTREVLILQACDVLISSFDGNLEQFEEDFLLRYAEIASKLKEKHTIGEIQGQVYHQIGFLMPMPNNDPKFLQIYFMGNEKQQRNARCQYNHIEQMEEQEIVGILEPFLKNHNQLVQLFNTVSNRLLNDNYTIVIKADKVPSGQHAGRYNAPTINEVAVVMVGDAFERQDI